MVSFGWIPCVRSKACSICCTVFSLVATFFLIMLGIMMESQPEYMVLPPCEGADKDTCADTTDECYSMCKDERANGLFAGAGFYIATAVLAGMAWVKHARADPDCGRSGHAYEMDDLNQSLLASETSQ